jgi:hypothetical protein
VGVKKYTMGAKILLHYYKSACGMRRQRLGDFQSKIFLLRSESKNIIIIYDNIILQSSSKVVVDVEIYCPILIG